MSASNDRRMAAWRSGMVMAVSAAVICCGGLVASVEAAFVAPNQWSRGQADTTYQEWAGFSSAAGPNGPNVGVFNPNGTPDVADTSGSSFLTSGGNIYSFSGPLDIAVTVPDYAGGGNVTTVVLQVRTLGTEIAPATLQIAGIVPVDQAELSRTALGGMGGYEVESWYKFELPYSASSFTIEFEATGPHMSLSGVAVDTITAGTFVPEPNPIPEPATVLLSLGGLFLICSRRHGAKH